MTDLHIRSDNVDVEQIMGQIRARIREKRGVDYTEEEIKELANARLEKFLDPRGVRSDLIEQFRTKREASLPPNFTFEDTTLFETHRPFLRFIRRMLMPILKLFFNPTPLSEALHIQSKLNAQQAWLEPLHYEVMHNLVVETTRLGIEVKNLKMRLESMSSRLDFDERRARALEGVVQYRAGAVPPLQPPTASTAVAGSPLETAQQERRTRRRRRRGRKTGFGSGSGEGETRTGFGGAPAAAPSESRRGFGEAGSGPAETRGGFGEVPPQSGGSGEGEPVPTKPRGDGGGEVG
ncbi:MAG: hypothetical protein H0W18_00765 [Acidobacteria bacterium]|nr:hypothetical protein [Acidobacteriota bacterium]